jgi:hypothetical protein
MKIFKINILAVAGVAFAGMVLSSCFKKFDSDSYAPPLNIGGFTSVKEIAPANLVGYWSFNGSYVDSVSGTAGTNKGTTFTAGIKGQAMQGATNGYVTFVPGAAIKGMHSFTITQWVNSPLNSAGIVGLTNMNKSDAFWGNIDIFFENGGSATNSVLKLHFTNNGADAWLGNYNIANRWNTWMNVAVTYDEATSTFKVFIDGSKIATQVIANYGAVNFTNATTMVFGTVQFQTTPSLTTGSGSQPWASFLTGQLDEVRIYNKALSENEVNSLVKLEGRGK